MQWVICLAFISMMWEHNDPPVDHYTIYYRTTALVKFMPMTTATGKRATVKVDGRRHYWFKVTATRKGKESGESNTLYVPRGSK